MPDLPQQRLLTNNLKTVLVSEIGASLTNTGGHGLLTLADPDTGVVVLLVGLVGTVGVADLGCDVVLLVEDKVADTGEVSPLGVGVDVHLYDTSVDGSGNLLLGGSGATVEDKEAVRSAKVQKGNYDNKGGCATDMTPPRPRPTPAVSLEGADSCVGAPQPWLRAFKGRASRL